MTDNQRYSDVDPLDPTMTWHLLLQLKRDRFTEELESYAKLVEEFASYGEMSDVPRYLKKAQALDAKLQAAADKVRRRLDIGSI